MISAAMPQRYGALTALVTGFQSTIRSRNGGQEMDTNKQDRKYSSLKVILPIVIVLVLLFSSFAVYQVIRTRAGKDEKVVALIPYRKGDKWGFCNRDRKMVIPTVYDSVDLFSEGLAPVHLNSKCGYIDTKGTMVIPAVYDSVDPFIKGLASVHLNGKWGYIDT
ncbi:WG repeat-containing protein, partial [Candidatus Cryosericum odellii]